MGVQDIMAREGAGVSAEEVRRFGALAPRWWDPSGPMRELHRMNALRIGWSAHHIRAGHGDLRARVLDLGCGGGIASEALARAGFLVTGLDASPEAVGAACAHALEGGLDVAYRVGLAEDLLAEETRYDAITAFEVIEHVPDQPAFVSTAARLLAPGGVLVVSTLNRTVRSLAVAKIGAEYVARLLPAGTHDWRRFVQPAELAAMGRQAGLRLLDVSGMVPTGAGWASGRDLAINYIAAFGRD